MALPGFGWPGDAGGGAGEASSERGASDAGPVFASSSGAGDGGDCGTTNDHEGCSCETEGQTQRCYVGNPSMAGVGVCTWGTQTCHASGEFAQWGACTGYGTPSAPQCGIDYACNGTANSCATPDAGQPSPTGPSPTGQPCTPGSLEQDPDAGDPSGNGLGSVNYCDGTGVWQRTFDGHCVPEACKSCLQQYCAQDVTSVSGACNTGLQQAFNWLAACGPDRASYFQTFGAACSGGELATLETCKNQNCLMGGAASTPCSIF